MKYKNGKWKKFGNPAFGFHFTSYEKTVKEVNGLKSMTGFQNTAIPVKIVKQDTDILSDLLQYNFNNSLSCSPFPTGMKYAEDTPIYKKDHE